MPRDEKYVVLKRQDWEQLLSDVHLDDGGPEPGPPIEDAVVIRLQDLFAGPALHHYAASIRTVIDVFTSIGIDPPTAWAAPEVTDRLITIADYFHECAVEADRLQTKKVPD